MALNRRVSAVLCSTDLIRSQEFYEQKVGLTLSPETIPNHLLFESSDGSTVLVYGRPAPNQADHTQVRFWSTDVERDVKDLLALDEHNIVEGSKPLLVYREHQAKASA